MRTAMFLVITILSVPAGVTRAQEGPLPEEGPPSGTINIVFPGGSLESYVQVLTEQSKETNIVLSPRATDIPVPPLSLKNVSVNGALEVLLYLTREGPRSVSMQRISQRERGRPGAPSRELFVLSSGEKQPGSKEFRVFSIRTPESARGLPQAQARLEAVLQAVDSALQIHDTNPEEKPMIKLHPDSGLLLVQGSKNQVQAVSQVIEALQGQGDPQLQARVRDLEEEVTRLRAEIEELRKAARPPAGK